MERTSFLSSAMVVFLLHFCIAISTMAAVRNITTDQSALLSLKAHITYDPQHVLATNWTTSFDICNWVGVTCSTRHHKVTALNLSYMGLVGTIPPHLGNLSFLTELLLTNNSFHGSPPKELAQLRRLKVISFQSNNFGGEIPSWFGLLQNLKSIYLSSNSFTGSIPPSLSNISSLQIINLSSNQLSGSLPPNLFNMSSLQTIDLGFNQLSGSLPCNLFNMSSIQTLDLRKNKLSGSIPSTILNMSSLQIFNLSYNSLSGSLPASMFDHFPKLERLYLSTNEFSGQIPSSLFKCKQLQVLSLSFNYFGGRIPREIGNLTMLTEIHLGYANFQGAIPHEICDLRNLTWLNLHDNNLTGVIPSEIFNISTIKIISLFGNNLFGHLPSSTGTWLPNLEELNLWGNKLSGPIPSSISNASELAILELSNNSFSGNLKHLRQLNLGDNYLTSTSSTPELSFLSSLTNCKGLAWVVLDGNPLNDTLPSSIGNLSTSLQLFSATNCNIKGNIPREIGNLSILTVLYLQNNGLSGSIPSIIGTMQKLQGLSLVNNRLIGSIPNEICHLRDLVELHLGQNKLFGSIPTCLGNLTSLRKLGLNSNELTSIIPSTLWSLKDILDVNLSSNFLSGHLPLDIGSLRAVLEIDLSRNHLLGEIPSTIGGLQTLTTLSLAHNQLYGPIPSSVGNMISLEFMDLSANSLSGVIPKSLEALKFLKFLNVSLNRLQGEIPTRGRFPNFSAQSFLGNDALCGAPRLQLPPCKTSTIRRSRTTTALILKYILPIIVSTILVLVRRRKRNVKFPNEEDMLTLATWRRISYQVLQQATDGFSESNLLGKGGFGSVYLGTLSDGMHIAVKVFNLQLEGAFKSFDAECEVIRNIRHRNLLKIISSCSNNADFKALVLEYMPNGSLEKWLYSHNHCLDILQRLSIMLDVALALEYLHHGYMIPIVHCDLKPNNILLDEDMVAHVADFGIAKMLGEEESMTHTKTLATIGYMAPEYGSEGIISTRGDVYSYGILLMETFTRQKPTDDKFVGGMSLKHWVKESLPHAVIEVADANLFNREEENFSSKKESLLSIMELAVNCSAESPEERLNMKDVVVRLKDTKIKFQKSVVRT